MTPTEAAALHARSIVHGGIIVWYVTLSDPERPGKAVAWARVGDHHGGHRVPGELVADTIEEVRAMLPAGLTRIARAVPEWGTVEVWEVGAARRQDVRPRSPA